MVRRASEQGEGSAQRGTNQTTTAAAATVMMKRQTKKQRGSAGGQTNYKKSDMQFAIEALGRGTGQTGAR